MAGLAVAAAITAKGSSRILVIGFQTSSFIHNRCTSSEKMLNLIAILAKIFLKRKAWWFYNKACFYWHSRSR